MLQSPQDQSLVQHYYRIKDSMFFVLGGLILTTNLICCYIMASFIRMVKRIASRAQASKQYGKESILEDQIQVNSSVIILHIIMISAYTVACSLEIIIYPLFEAKAQDRVFTCFYFATGAIDIFVSYIIWFSLDEDLDIPIMLKDE